MGGTAEGGHMDAKDLSGLGMPWAACARLVAGRGSGNAGDGGWQEIGWFGGKWEVGSGGSICEARQGSGPSRAPRASNRQTCLRREP